MAFRLLVYMVRAWEAYLKDHPSSVHLPVILPFVLHHSDEGWTRSTSLEALLEVEPEMLLGLRGDVLTVEANSVARAQRARELVERLGAGLIRHRATTHEDLQRKIAERMTAGVLGQEDKTPDTASQALDPDIAEALIVEHYARHYRGWVDEPVPALDGRTPREAAKSQEMRPSAFVRCPRIWTCTGARCSGSTPPCPTCSTALMWT